MGRQAFAFSSPIPSSFHRSALTCSQIPAGARPAPRPSLTDRLEGLQFGYESSDCAAPGCIRYICRNGHLVTVRAGSPACVRCPTCDFSESNPCRRPLCIPKLQMTARERNGVLLSTVYVNAHQPLMWRCASGHEWAATADNVRRRGSWCPECAHSKKRAGIAQMHELAARFGGECLSETYVKGNEKLKWRCAHGHIFEMAPNNIKRKPGGKRKPSWCTVCRKQDVAAFTIK